MKERLDVLLVNRGYFDSREKAKRAIMAGLVFVEGQLSDKAGTSYDTECEITVKGDSCPFVSRGGLKLARAVEVFGIDLGGAVCADIGASTGGFTDCMLQSGAKKVYSIDVGYGQLDYNMEGAGSEKTLDDFYLGRGYRLNYYNIEALLARVYQYMGEDELAFQCAKNVMEFKAEGYQGQTYEMFTADDWYTISSQINVEKRTDVKVVSNLIFALYNEESYEDYNLSNYFYKESSNSQFGNSQWLTVDIKGQSIFLNTDGNDEHNADYRCKFQMFTPEYNRFQDDGGAEEGYPNSPYRLTTKWYCSEDETVRDKNAQLLPIIRATEMRYIMAEHYARIGQYEDAYEILRQIRERRGLYSFEYPLNTKNSLDGFLADMIRDAQREWISEGQLFYLYKRLGAKVVVKSGEAARKLNKSEYMLPIPDNQNM